MKKHIILYLILCLGCHKAEDISDTFRSLTVTLKQNNLSLEQAESLISKTPQDSLSWTGYVLNLSDEDRQENIFLEELSLESTDSILIPTVKGDFEIHIYHPQYQTISEYGLEGYALNGDYYGNSAEDMISITMENQHYAYVTVESNDYELSEVKINDSSIFPFSTNSFFAYLDTRHNSFYISLVVDGVLLEKDISDLQADKHYKFTIIEEGRDKDILLEVFQGFEGDSIDEEWTLEQTTSNILINGDFEIQWIDDYSPYGWDIYENIQRELNIVSHLNNAARQSDGLSILSQEQEAQANENYIFSFDYYISEGDGSDARIWGAFKNEQGESIANIRGETSYLNGEMGQWNHFSREYNSPEGTSYVEIQLRTYEGAIVYWDNFKLKKRDSN